MRIIIGAVQKHKQQIYKFQKYLLNFKNTLFLKYTHNKKCYSILFDANLKTKQ